MTMFKRQAVKNKLDKLNTAADTRADAVLDAAGRKIEQAKASKISWAFFLFAALFLGGVLTMIWLFD